MQATRQLQVLAVIVAVLYNTSTRSLSSLVVYNASNILIFFSQKLDVIAAQDARSHAKAD